MIRVLLFLVVLPLAAQQQAAPGSVRGKVVNAINGDPIRKARVLLRSTFGNYGTDTDSTGAFTIDSVSPGDYEAAASRPRFNTVSPADIPRFKLAAGQNVAGLLLRLTPLGAISGRILDSEGDPLTGMSVEALQYAYINGREQLQSIQTVQVDDRGQYRLFDLLPGRYYIAATPGGPPVMVTATVSRPDLTKTFLGDTINSKLATPVDLPAAGEISGSDIRIQRSSGYSIRGRTTGGTAQIILQKRVAQGNPVAQLASILNGSDRFEFSGLSPGTWLLRAQAINIDIQARILARTVPPVPSLREALRVIEIVDHDIDGVELTFAPATEIGGVVKVAGSVPVALTNQRIQFQGAAGASVDAMLTPGGAFSLPQVSPDVYQIAISPVGSSYVTSVKLGDHESQDRKLDLQQGGGGALTVTVSGEFGQIEGRVSGDEKHPASGATVMLIPDQDSADSYQTTLSDSEGRFSFTKIRPAHYRVFAWVDPPKIAPPDSMGVSLEVKENGHHSIELTAIGALGKP